MLEAKARAWASQLFQPSRLARTPPPIPVYERRASAQPLGTKALRLPSGREQGWHPPSRACHGLLCWLLATRGQSAALASAPSSARWACLPHLPGKTSLYIFWKATDGQRSCGSFPSTVESRTSEKDQITSGCTREVHFFPKCVWLSESPMPGQSLTVIEAVIPKVAPPSIRSGSPSPPPSPALSPVWPASQQLGSPGPSLGPARPFTAEAALLSSAAWLSPNVLGGVS